jgi:hypothetical protein
MKHRFRRIEARRRIGREQAKAAECCLDRSADRVVDTDGLDATGHDIGRRFACCCIDEAAILAFDEQRMVGTGVEPACLQCGQYRCCPGMARYGQRLDAMPNGIETRRCQCGERFVRRLRAAHHWRQCQCDEQQHAGNTLHLQASREQAGGGPGKSRATPMEAISSGNHAFLPPPVPHLPVFTLNAPHDSGARQSPIRSLVSATYGDHSCATTRPGVCETMLN